MDTIEAAVSFYTSAAFTTSPAGAVVGPISLTASDIADVGAFLRVINALENVESSRVLASKAKTASNFGQANKLLLLSIQEVGDAIVVLWAQAYM